MKQFVVSISLLVAVAFSICVHATDITIGVNLSTTGSGAPLGIPEKNALTFAPSTIAGHKVRYVVYDDSSDSTISVQNMKRLTTQDNVDLVLGPTLTTSSLAVINAAAESKTPTICFSAAKAIVAPMDERRKWMFKATPNDEIYAAATVRHMVKKGVKSVSLIAIDDPFGESNTQEFKKLADEAGVKILAMEKFKRDDTSVTAQVLRAIKGNPDAVYIMAVGTPSALPHLSLVERGYKGKVYHTASVANPDFLRLGGKAVEGAIVPGAPVIVADQLPDGYPTKAEGLRYLKAYESRFGNRSEFAAKMWDALNMVSAAVPQALKSSEPGTVAFREALRTAIENTKGFKGAGQVVTFTPTDHSGVDQLGVTVFRIENGGWKLDDYAAFK